MTDVSWILILTSHSTLNFRHKISHRMTTHPCSQQASNMTLQHARSKSAVSLISPLRVHFLPLDSWGRNPVDHDKAQGNKWNTKSKRNHIQAPVFIRLRTRNIMRKKGLSHARKMPLSRGTPSNKWTKTFGFSFWIFKFSEMPRLLDTKTVTNVAKNRSTNFNVKQNRELQLREMLISH